MKKTILTLAAGLAAAAAISTAVPAQASPAAISTEVATGQIQVVAHLQWCLAAPGLKANSGVVVQNCAPGVANQTWVITKKPNAQVWISPSYNAGLCIGQSTRNTALVVLRPCPPKSGSSDVLVTALADGVYGVTFQGRVWMTVTNKLTTPRVGTYPVNWQDWGPEHLLSWLFPKFHATHH